MMIHSSMQYLAIAAVGPAVTTIAQQPEAFFEGTAASVLGAVGLAIWRCASLATKHLEGQEAHRQLEIKHWDAMVQHMQSQREHWARARRSPPA